MRPSSNAASATSVDLSAKSTAASKEGERMSSGEMTAVAYYVTLLALVATAGFSLYTIVRQKKIDQTMVDEATTYRFRSVLAFTAFVAKAPMLPTIDSLQKMAQEALDEARIEASVEVVATPEQDDDDDKVVH